MKKGTLALVLLLAAAAAWYIFVERSVKSPEESARAARRLFDIKAERIASIQITDEHGETALIERSTGDGWRLRRPVSGRADRWAADGVAGALADLARERAITNERGEEGLREMGFAPPRARVAFTLRQDEASSGKEARGEGASPGTPAATLETPPAGGAAATARARTDAAAAVPASESAAAPAGATALPATVLEIGAEVPGTPLAFARVVGGNSIDLVQASTLTALLKSPGDLRDRALLAATVLDVEELSVARPEGPLSFRKRDEDWWIEEPFQDLAEGSVVSGLVGAILGLRAEEFLEVAPPAPATMNTGSAGAGPGGLRALVRLGGKDGQPLGKVEIGLPAPDAPDRAVVAVESPDEAPLRAAASTSGLSALGRGPQEFRAKSVLPFRTWDATGLELAAPGVSLSFTRKEGAWTATSPAELQPDSGAIDQTLQALSDLLVASYDAGEGRGPTALGLEPARQSIVVTLEGAIRPRRLLLGEPAGSAGHVYAKLEGRPGIFTVPDSILDRIRGGAALYARKPEPATEPGAGEPAPAGNDGNASAGD